MAFRGRTADVDLSSRQIEVGEIPSRELDLFLGGRALASALLYREVPGDVGPLDPANALIFMTGPLTGTRAPGTGRHVVATRSPLTGAYTMGLAGGLFGTELRKSGWDGLVVRGAADSPVYLLIDGSKITFKDATHLWGLTTSATEQVIKRELGDKEARVCCIGPAGENLVPYAVLINERRAAGRGGVGAVMGSKRLKAIVVKGDEKIPVANPVEFRKSLRLAYKELRGNPVTGCSFPTYGSSAIVALMAELGIFPWKNWQVACDRRSRDLSGEAFLRDHTVWSGPCCLVCPVKCTRVNAVKHSDLAGNWTEGPDYETVFSFGSNLGISDPAVVITADHLCDEFGLDTISAGVSIGFAMECRQRGILTKKDTDGYDLVFGNAGEVLRVLPDIAYRRGFGAVLASGTRKMAEQFGRDSDAFAMHVKGMEMGGYDPRGAKSMALVFACGSRGGCHHVGGYTVQTEALSGEYDRFADHGKAALVRQSRDRRAGACDSAIMCSFVAMGVSDQVIAGLVGAATGEEIAPSDLSVLGERTNAVERMFNLRCGLTPADDELPNRLTHEQIAEGPSAGNRVDLAVMKEEFYQECGWDPSTGRVLPERLERLGLAGFMAAEEGAHPATGTRRP